MKLSDIVEMKRNTNKKASCQKCIYYDRPFVSSYFGNSEIIVIGEAPGKTEANLKCPFKGPSGQLLRKLLKEVGFDDEKISFLNTCCCNPPGNETPNKKAIALCIKQFLLPELEQIHPKIIILAGSVALNVFFPEYKIMEKKGNILRKDGMTFIPVLHPAYCLRNPQTVEILRKDLNKARLYLEGNISKEKKYYLLNTIELLDKYKKELLDRHILSVDIETNGKLNPFDRDTVIWTIAFGCEDFNVCIPLEHYEIENVVFKDKAKSLVEEILTSKIPEIFHNCSFDVKMLRKFGYKVNGFIHDTMVMSYLLDENKNSYGLKSLASEYLDGYSNTYSNNLKDLFLYNCEDTENTYRLYELFVKDLKKHPNLLRLYKHVVAPMCLVISDMEYNGILIDKKYCIELKEILQVKIKDIIKTIHKQFPEAINVDLRSPKQLATLLFDKLGYQTLKKTTGGARSVDADVLEKLASGNCEIAKLMLEQRTNEKLLSTYVKDVPSKLDIDGRLRGSINITGTRTGRLSASKPNLQNIPRDKTIKRMFIARDGFSLINMDASQAEIRIACSIADEKNMIKAYNKGMDIHKLTASGVLNKDIDKVTKNDRQKAKGVNFGFIYGASAEGFMMYAEREYGLKLSLKESIRYRNSYFEMYPGLLTWYKEIEKSLRVNGYIEYPTGRFARFLQVKGLREIPSDILRKGINYPVQGSSSDIILYTMVCLKKFIDKSKIEAYIVITVHDSIVVECKDENIEDIVEEISNIAKIDIPKFFTWLKVPWVYDYAVGKNWGEMKKI